MLLNDTTSQKNGPPKFFSRFNRKKIPLHHNSAHNCRSSLDSNSLAQTHWAAPLLVCYLFVGLRHVFRPEIRSSPLFFRQLLFSVPPSPLVVWNMIRPEAVSAVPGQSQQQQQLVSSVKKRESRFGWFCGIKCVQRNVDFWTSFGLTTHRIAKIRCVFATAICAF